MLLAHYEIKFKKYYLCNQSMLFDILNLKKKLKIFFAHPIAQVFVASKPRDCVFEFPFIFKNQLNSC